MPVRRRVAQRPTRDVDWRLFRVSDGTWAFFPHHAVYPDVATARPAWCRVRRDVWAISRRTQPPAAAIAYDGLTRDGFEALWSDWRVTTFASREAFRVMEALDRDRASVMRFRRKEPRAARVIADYLDVWLRYLDTLECVTRDLMRRDVDPPNAGSVLQRIQMVGTFADAVADESEGAG